MCGKIVLIPEDDEESTHSGLWQLFHLEPGKCECTGLPIFVASLVSSNFFTIFQLLVQLNDYVNHTMSMAESSFLQQVLIIFMRCVIVKRSVFISVRKDVEFQFYCFETTKRIALYNYVIISSSRFLVKTLRANKPAMKKFLKNLSFGIEVPLTFTYKINAHNMSGAGS